MNRFAVHEGFQTLVNKCQGFIAEPIIKTAVYNLFLFIYKGIVYSMKVAY